MKTTLCAPDTGNPPDRKTNQALELATGNP